MAKGNGRRSTTKVPGRRSTTEVPVGTAQRNQSHHPGGLFGAVRDSQIPREYLTASVGLNEAAIRSFLIDENEVNDVTRLFAKLDEFNVTAGLETLMFWLDARRGIRGRANSFSAMTHTQILVPEVMTGSKKEAESIRRETEKVKKQRENEEQHPA